MSVNYSDLAITSLETITAFDVTTGAFMWVLDELQSATISHSEDTTDITGKQGRLLNTLKRNKAVTVSGNNGLISGGLLATQVGSEFEEKTTTVMWPDYIVVTGNSPPLPTRLSALQAMRLALCTSITMMVLWVSPLLRMPLRMPLAILPMPLKPRS